MSKKTRFHDYANRKMTHATKNITQRMPIVTSIGTNIILTAFQ